MRHALKDDLRDPHDFPPEFSLIQCPSHDQQPANDDNDADSDQQVIGHGSSHMAKIDSAQMNRPKAMSNAVMGLFPPQTKDFEGSGTGNRVPSSQLSNFRRTTGHLRTKSIPNPLRMWNDSLQLSSGGIRNGNDLEVPPSCAHLLAAARKTSQLFRGNSGGPGFFGT